VGLSLLRLAPAQAAVIDACVDNKKGTMRVVTPSTTCTSKETLLQWNSTGPPGDPGAPGPPGPPGASLNPLQIAILHWYDTNQTWGDFPVGSFPLGVAFDGANIWTANFSSNTVSKR